MRIIACILLAIILVPIAANLANCHNVGKLFWNPGHQTTANLARFYYLVLLALAIIIVQNTRLRRD